MLVKELIEKLRTFPEDAAVVYQTYSDWQGMEADEIDLVTAEESERLVREEDAKAHPHIVRNAVELRNGYFCRAYPKRMRPEGETPVYVTVVTFPGN